MNKIVFVFWILAFIFSNVASAQTSASTPSKDIFDDIKNAATTTAYITALTAGAIAILRKHFWKPEGRLVLAISVVVGVLFSLGLLWFGLLPFYQEKILFLVLLGIIGGLSASGSIDVVRAARK